MYSEIDKKRQQGVKYQVFNTPTGHFSPRESLKDGKADSKTRIDVTTRSGSSDHDGKGDSHGIGEGDIKQLTEPGIFGDSARKEGTGSTLSGRNTF